PGWLCPATCCRLRRRPRRARADYRIAVASRHADSATPHGSRRPVTLHDSHAPLLPPPPRSRAEPPLGAYASPAPTASTATHNALLRALVMDQRRTRVSTSSRILVIVLVSGASTFSLNNGSVFDGRRLNHAPPSSCTVSPSSRSVSALSKYFSILAR